MPSYYIEMAKDGQTDEVKQNVIKHCNIEYFYKCAGKLGWIITNCVEVDDKDAFMSQYIEVSPARRMASEADIDSVADQLNLDD